jgi:hypothetical protein
MMNQQLAPLKHRRKFTQFQLATQVDDAGAKCIQNHLAQDYFIRPTKQQDPSAGSDQMPGHFDETTGRPAPFLNTDAARAGMNANQSL